MLLNIENSFFHHKFTRKFAQAETRAEFAERSVQKLQKEVDRLEGTRSGGGGRGTATGYI